MLSMRNSIIAFIAYVGVAVFSPSRAMAQEKSIVIASTTSTQDSGLYEHLLPIFTRMTGIAVKVLAQGTGQALDAARRGDADVVFVHAKFAELRFIAEGHGVKRLPVMYNDFVVVGPKIDPAGIKGMDDVAEALQRIRNKQAIFISRGDSSGTHQAELALWNKDVGIDIEKDNGAWYQSSGQSMEATLDIASARDGYALSDRATWSHFKNKNNLQILVAGDNRLFNQYGVILVNSDKHPNVQKELGQAFIDWLVSPEGQKAIADYKIDGEQLFFSNADDPNA
jgi:tungstate transport system substrate-binding protein